MTPLAHVTECASMVFLASKTAMRLFTQFMACMGVLMWLGSFADAPFTWEQAWPFGIAIWAVCLAFSLMMTGRI